MVTGINENQAPYNQPESSCQNCDGQGEDRTSHDGVQGCTDCIKRCPICGCDIDTVKTPLIEMLVNKGIKGVLDYRRDGVCHACYDDFLVSPEDYKDDLMLAPTSLLKLMGEAFVPLTFAQKTMNY